MFSFRPFASSLLIAASFAIAGCQQGGPLGAVKLGGNQQQSGQVEPVLESELRAYCPPVTLREGTAYFRTYAKGGEGDASKIIYQASIEDVTRSCRRGEGAFTMTVAVAGKVVPGPVGAPGTITMPIRVAATRGEEVVYSQLFQHSVTISDTSGATQFIFTNPNVVIPGLADRSIQVMVGYDEGPAGGN